MRNVPEHVFVSAIWSFAGSFTFAFATVLVRFAYLPETDAAFGTAPFAHPIAAGMTCVFAGLCALLAFPFAFWALRAANMVRATAVTLPLVLGFIVIGTPLGARLALLGTFASSLLALLVCRQWSWVREKPRESGGSLEASL